MNNDRWVKWEELVNRSRGQTLVELREFLYDKRLMTPFGGWRGTRKAFYLRFVKEIDGNERWHLKTYVSMMQSHHKVLKLQRQSRPVARADYQRALIDLPTAYSEKDDHKARFEHLIGR